jgi:hypothetical protein
MAAEQPEIQQAPISRPPRRMAVLAVHLVFYPWPDPSKPKP